jgi:Right handed beta helix region
VSAIAFRAGSARAPEKKEDPLTHRLLTALAAVSIAASGALVAAPASTARVLDVGAAAAAATAPPTFYVDATSGNDARRGTSAATAWKSLAKVTAATFAPGTRVLLRRGGTFGKGFTLAESGRPGAPITVSTYGAGAQPVITGGGARGACVLLSGSWLVLDGITADRCGYSGIGVSGDHDTVRNTRVSRHATGIYVKSGSDYGTYTGNTLVDNNIENVNTPSPGGDDSGAFGFLIHGDHNLFSRNTVRGSVARSYDWVWDGGAFEIYDGDHNTITGNLAVDNNNFSELGHSKKQSAVVGNVFTRNTIRATCASCSEARGLIVRGAKVKYGPNIGTVFADNTVQLTGPTARGVTCHAGCTSAILTMRNNTITVTSGRGYAVWSDAAFLQGGNLLHGRVSMGR